ncbi:DUF1918 domain-containing protein [Jiangella rhizosphaerae]|uniref:DUF1918 domain-containing protein n=1 Tax=Jiangella rhizosphaerae TaxID=2293569 RepID=A0A418KKX3_9ACTN|nr:DUF1918 domain-containing protein [Jiangella rhizosphaerae]RIQ18225.1 DUF1918 domain-containing protein [Jiangella rhizosphaerae]
MRAHVGDRILIKGHLLGEHGRDGEVLEVRGAGGEPPYVVRWSDDGAVTLIFPGPDAAVHHQRRHLAQMQP